MARADDQRMWARTFTSGEFKRTLRNLAHAIENEAYNRGIKEGQRRAEAHQPQPLPLAITQAEERYVIEAERNDTSVLEDCIEANGYDLSQLVSRRERIMPYGNQMLRLAAALIVRQRRGGEFGRGHS